MSNSNMMTAGKKRKVEYTDNSSDSNSSWDNKNKPHPDNIEKSLTNLQINMRALAGKMEDMMTAFQSFCEQFQANHRTLVEDMEELKGLAIDVKKCFADK